MAKTKQRAPGTGQIIPRGEGTYLLRVYVGRTADGKKKYANKTVKGTISQARQALTALQREVDTDTFIAPTRQTVEQFLTEWLEGKLQVLAQTRANYATTLRTYVFSTDLARVRLTEVRRPHVQRLYKEMAERGLSARTIQYVHMILRQAFESAVIDNRLQRNPTDHTERPKLNKSSKVVKPQVLSPTEVVTFLAKHADDEQYGALWAMLLMTGMRPQEALALKWSDLEGDSVTIRRVIAIVGGRQVLQEGRAKTDGSMRVVSLPEEVLKALKTLRVTQAKARLRCGKEWKDNAWMFAGRQGRLRDLQAVRKAWKKALDDAGLAQRRLYNTRHTHITHLIEAGVPAAVVAERVGNSAAITLSTYTSVLDETKRKLADKTTEILYGTNQLTASEAR